MKKLLVALGFLLSTAVYAGQVVSRPAQDWHILVERLDTKEDRVLIDRDITSGERIEFDGYKGAVSISTSTDGTIGRFTLVVQTPNKKLAVGTTVWATKYNLGIGHVSIMEKKRTYSITITHAFKMEK